MSKPSLLATLLCVALGASAQPRPPAPAPAPLVKPQAQIDAMARLSWLAGDWEGSASFTTPAGSRQARSSEHVRMGAGGTALLIHGLHRDVTAEGQVGEVAHDAMALLVFDEKTGKYRVSSQTKEGRGGHFEGRMEGETFQWFIPFPGGHMRYDIRRGEAGEWLEQGHFCRDGSPCMTTLSMTLKRSSKPLSAMAPPITIRALRADDCLQTLTALLHAAYASLAARGLNFTAVDQSVETTRERVQAGHCLVLEEQGQLVGTITVSGPKPAASHYLSDPVPALYCEPDVALLAQLAVHPARRGQGLAERLMEAAEAWAGAAGYRRVALDTAEPAEDLRRRYARRGYADVGTVQWSGKTYRSVLMAKTLRDRPA